MNRLARRLAAMSLLAFMGGVSACGGTSSSPDASGGAGGDAGAAGSGGSPVDIPEDGGMGGIGGAIIAEGGAGGSVDDTLCQDAARMYAGALDVAMGCDPMQQNQCTTQISSGLVCTCDVFANTQNTAAIAAVNAAQREYVAGECGRGEVLCGACARAQSGYCSAEGRCVTITDSGGPVACKVGGLVYPSGAENIPDPVSCNTCQCFEGELICTEMGCPKPCPPDSAFGTQCAQCGPTDGCDVVEHACLPVCTDVCESGPCVDGICRSLCG